MGAASAVGESLAKKKKPAQRSSVSFGDHLTFNREEQHKRKLAVILKTATYCLNELGYSGTSLRTLAAQLKITDSALYHYVESKEELAALCYTRTLELSENALKRANQEGSTGLAKLQSYIKYQIESTCGPDGPTATLSDLPSLHMAQRIQILERIDRAHKLVMGFFETGFKDGTIGRCNAQYAALVIWGSMAFLAKWFDRHGKLSVDELAATYVHVLTRGVAAK
jgi:AcrR family transcriptional regulator